MADNDRPMTDERAQPPRGARQIARLAAEMQAKLDANAHKPGWRDQPLGYLRDRVRDELREIDKAVVDRADPAEVWREAADVCNFVMMVADKYEAIWLKARR